MRSSLFQLVGGVAIGACALGVLAGCEDKPAPPPATSQPAPTAAPQATAAATATATATAEPAAAGDSKDAEQAAEKMWDYYQKIAELIDKHGKDCKKLGEELKAFAEKDKTAEEMKKLAASGGGKPAVEQAMEKKYGDKYEEVSDKILEATEIDCAKDSGVKEAAKLMDL